MKNKMSPLPDDLVFLSEACALYDYSVRHAKRWIAEGKLKSYGLARTMSGQLSHRVSADEFEELALPPAERVLTSAKTSAEVKRPFSLLYWSMEGVAGLSEMTA